jgi:hypothetical protein
MKLTLFTIRIKKQSLIIARGVALEHNGTTSNDWHVVVMHD